MNALRALIKKARAKADLMPAEILRIIVSNMGSVSESLNDRYTFEQLLCIYLAQYVCEWDFYPDDWTERQLREATHGIVPQWTDDEKPLYAKRGET